MHTSKFYLSPEQIEKLRRVLNPIIPIYPSPSSSAFPTLHLTPREFLRNVYLKLREHEIDVSCVRLNGGAASYVLINDSKFAYRDIDILFVIETPLTSQRETKLFAPSNESYSCDVWTIIKYIICSCLIQYMSDVQPCTPKFLSSILDTYSKKNIQITSEQDCWALLSLQNLLGRNLELKFVNQWKRQWQFTVDSFQIDLQSLLLSSSQSITRQVLTDQFPIEAFNALTIRKKNEQTGSNSLPIQFGTLTPPSTPLTSSDQYPNKSNKIPHETLTIVTTIDTSNQIPLKTHRRSIQPSALPPDEDLSEFLLQFQISQNEDIDDGIVVDTDGSTTEDDESVYRTPPTEIDAPLQIEVFCAYHDIHQALHHLNNKLIATFEPEKLRGGGLLKYCDLLAQNYKPHDRSIMEHMQRYMCSRFFIDFKTLPEQMSTISKYVATHFLPCSMFNEQYEINYPQIMRIIQNRSHPPQNEIDQTELINARLCLLFFDYFSLIIQQSCVCLNGDDKDLLLFHVRYLQECYHYESEHLFTYDVEHHKKYHQPLPVKSYPHSRSSRPPNRLMMTHHQRRSQ